MTENTTRSRTHLLPTRRPFRPWRWVARRLGALVAMSLAPWLAMVVVVSRGCWVADPHAVLPAPPASVPTAQREELDRLRAGVSADRLRRHVEFLADDDLAGRAPGSTGNRLAREYLVANFRQLGLRPVFGDSYEQPGRDKRGEFVNLAGLLPASVGDPDSAEIVAVIAHFDHVGVRNGKVHPGADDNAAAVAALLEVARQLATGAADASSAANTDVLPRRCHVLFLCPDAEESGLRGSAYFVAHPPPGLAISRVRTAIVMDLVGNEPSPKLTGRVFVVGSESAPELAGLVSDVPGGARARPIRLSVGCVETIPFARGLRGPVSDYDAFRLAGRPFVFLSCGRHPRYHTPEDRPEFVPYDKLADVSRYVLELTARVASVPSFARAGSSPNPAAAIDVAGDLAALGDALTALSTGDPGELNARVFAQLAADRETVAELAHGYRRDGRLSEEQIRRYQLIAVRVQLALWQPKSEASLNF